MRQRLGRSWRSLTSRFLNSMREKRPIRKTLRLTCTRSGQLRDRSRAPTMICIPNGIRLLFSTTYLSHRSGGEIVVQQQYRDYIRSITVNEKPLSERRGRSRGSLTACIKLRHLESALRYASHVHVPTAGAGGSAESREIT